ncbi:MAG: fibronectin type III domain-containing protein, partial [Thermoplasmatota archaeon]
GDVISGLYMVRWDSSDPQDPKTELRTDIWLIDGEDSMHLLTTDENNTGSFLFDTTGYPDADGYRLMINVTDTDGITTSVMSGNFSIFNNDIPSVEFLTPMENQTLRGTFEVSWASEDQESLPGELTVALYYRFGESSLWNELIFEENNSGSFYLDTLSLIEGDGEYELQIILEDPHGGISEPDLVTFFVYNPDPPVIILPYMIGPYEPVRNGEAYFEWRVSDPDPGETDQLKIWILISSDNETWEEIVSGIPNENEYILNVTGLEDQSYFVKLLVSDCQPGEDNRTVEALFPRQMIVNNIDDPPTIELESEISADVTYSNEITFRWSSSDPDGDPVSYTLYYRKRGDNEWKTIPGASQMTETNFTWNISKLEEGYYQVKIVAREMTLTGMESEYETIAFYVKPVLFDIGDDDHSISVNSGMLVAIFACVAVLIVVLLWLLFLFAKKRGSSADIEQGDIQDQIVKEEE